MVSIIIPSYNKENYIAETIKSVTSQTYKNWELIVVDDLSNDNTLEIIKTYQYNNEKIKLFINPENKGANYSRNFGIKEAQGEFIIFLDADDVLSSDCLQNRIRHIENTNLDFCVFTLEVFKNDIGDTKQLWKPTTKEPLSDFLSHNIPWQTMQPIWKKEFLVNLGGFNEKFLRLQDVEIHTRALFQNGVNYRLINDSPDCFFRIDDDRKNFNNTNFLERWIDSALLYYSEFYHTAKLIGLEKKLIGTIFKTYLQLLYHYKTKRIDKIDFQYLKSKLFDFRIIKNMTWVSMLCFKLAGFYNILPFRIPGFNYLLQKIMML